MATVDRPIEQRTSDQRFLLHHISWPQYDDLLKALGERGSVRVTYDRGTVELVSPSREHEHSDQFLTRMVHALAEELDLPILSVGSMTCRREDMERGLEPDASFYLANELLVRTKKTLDLSVDPPPDLVIEVQYTSSIIDKVPIYASLGVPELWLYDMEELRVMRLDEHRNYVEQAFSDYFPAAAMKGVRQFIALRGAPHETAWAKNFRRWVRDNLIS